VAWYFLLTLPSFLIQIECGASFISDRDPISYLSSTGSLQLLRIEHPPLSALSIPAIR
jgi:hypothetical protein